MTDDDKPRWLVAAEQLREICGEELAPGQQLPPPDVLVERLRVPIGTLRTFVLPQLARWELIERRAESGWHTVDGAPRRPAPHEPPAWHALAERVAERLRQLQPGERLPAVPVLMDEFGASRRMITEYVLRKLADDGLVELVGERYWRRTGAGRAMPVGSPQSSPALNAKWPGVLARLRAHVQGLPPDTPLGSIVALSREWGLARETLHDKVLLQLAQEGWVVDHGRGQGRGWRTAKVPPPPPSLHGDR